VVLQLDSTGVTVVAPWCYSGVTAVRVHHEGWDARFDEVHMCCYTSVKVPLPWCYIGNRVTFQWCGCITRAGTHAWCTH
jgi:hypothetical protein